MTLPIASGVFADGELVTAASLYTRVWAAINAAQVQPSVVVPFNTSQVDVTTSLADWIPFGNVTVPTWATRARVTLNLNYFAVNATGNTVNGRVKLGTATGVTFRLIESSAVNVRVREVSTDLLTSVPTGSQALTFQAQRTVGTGSYRSDAGSWHSASIDFLP